jgi:hypothetical protein
VAQFLVLAQAHQEIPAIHCGEDVNLCVLFWCGFFPILMEAVAMRCAGGGEMRSNIASSGVSFQESLRCLGTPRRMKMSSPTDEMCQLMVYPLKPFIRWEMIFNGNQSCAILLGTPNQYRER